MSTRRPEGFTLLEVLAALLILATVIFASLEVQSQAISSATRIRQLAQAEAAAETAMDEFLATPYFVPVDLYFESDEVIEVPGYTDMGFEIRRIITERIPLDEQEALDVYEYEPVEPEEGEEEEEPWDPGTFVSIRIEVRHQSRLDRPPLVALEIWLPKPPTEEEEETESSMSASGNSGSRTTTGGGSGGGGRNTTSGGTGGANRNTTGGGSGATGGGRSGEVRPGGENP